MMWRTFMPICVTHRLCHELLVDNGQNRMLEYEFDLVLVQDLRDWREKRDESEFHFP